jgi:NAD(P)H dehydrogenase (quinone)
MYVVTGITGKVGGSVARTLLDAGLPIRAVVRNEAKGQPWAARGCEVAIADLDDAGPLTKAFSGTEGVFAMLPPLFDPSPGFPEAKAMIATLRSALEAAAPGKVVALSTVGADAPQPNLLNQLGLFEQALANLKTPVTFLRPAWFMENAAMDAAAARDQGVIQSYLQPLDRRVPMIATEDVGRTAGELLQETWRGHRVVELEAASRVSPDDIAAAFAKALGRAVRAEAVPPETWEGIFRRAGMKNPAPRIQMINGFNEGWIDYPDRGASARKGRVALDAVISKLTVEAS